MAPERGERRERLIRSVRQLGSVPQASGDGWRLVGQDGGQSIALEDETLFVFSDTLLQLTGGRRADALRPAPWQHSRVPPGRQIFLANCAARAASGKLSEALRDLRYYQDAAGRPRQILEPTAEEHRQGIRFWPAHGVFLDGCVYLFYLGIQAVNSASVWGFRNLGAGLATLDPETGECRRLRRRGDWCFWPVAEDDFHFGVQTLRQGDWIYVFFSSTRDQFVSEAGLARVAAAKIADPDAYVYRTARGGWSRSLDDRGVLGPASKGFSVSYNPCLERYLMVFVDSFHKVLYLRHARHLEGPYSEPHRVGALRHHKASELIYLGFEHATYARDEGATVWVSYCQPRFIQNNLVAVTFNRSRNRRGGSGNGSPEGVVHRDLSYGSQDEQRLDLHLPGDAKRPWPALIALYGGGWCAGHRTDPRLLRVTEPLVRRGYAVAMIDYRHVPRWTFPAQVDDAQLAVRWLRANAEEWGIDPDRLGALGGSAGGQLAALLGTCETWNPECGLSAFGSRVQAVVTILGVLDLRLPKYLAALSDEHHRRTVSLVLRDYLGVDYELSPDVWRRASPVCHVTPESAPFFIIHGTRDEWVPIAQPRQMVRALEEAGVEVASTFIEVMGHGGDDNPESAGAMARALEDAACFLDRHLRLVDGPRISQEGGPKLES